MYDQHVHTNYSPDSQTRMEDYIKHSSDKMFTFTDHYDLNDPWSNFKDQTYDVRAQRKEMDYLEEKYDIEILQGIEIGYTTKSKDKIKKVFADNSFDIVLLSVHHNDLFDYMETNQNMTELEIVEDYFDKVIEALNEVSDADVLTHLDFGLRMRKVSLDDIKTFEAKICLILSRVIELGMSLEINAKGIKRYNTMDMYLYFLSLYMELGGKDFVVNSDAHTVEVYKDYFPEIVSFLKSLGINQLNYYKKREKHSFSI